MRILETKVFIKAFKTFLLSSVSIFLLSLQGWADDGNWKNRIRALAGDGAVEVADTQGGALYSLNPHKPVVPASILKIVTADAALHHLGSGYRFTTVFRLSPEKDLYVVGKGDPHLVSEELARVAQKLKSKGLHRIRHIFLDNTYFQRGLLLHGANRSLNPYDAYNGALCVNFNTILVRIEPDGQIHSAEPQTPLTDFGRKAALRTGLKGTVRINLAESPEQCLLYAGELLKNFLKKASVHVEGRVQRATLNPEAFPLIYEHHSSWSLSELIEKMFKYSNNFIANQIFLTLGAEKYTPPATVEKSKRVMDEFLEGLKLKDLHMEEGSGISRRNRLTASQMIRVLMHFEPNRELLPHQDHAWFKTGTLSDVKSMAGYLTRGHHPPLLFVIILNGKRLDYRARDRILSLIRDNLLRQ